MFFADASNAVPSASSSAGSPPRGVVPASTSALTSRPVCRISNSGVAPTMPSQAKVKQSG